MPYNDDDNERSREEMRETMDSHFERCSHVSSGSDFTCPICGESESFFPSGDRVHDNWKQRMILEKHEHDEDD